MPNNIEIKARLNNIEKAHQLAKQYSIQPSVKILQLDTFFKTTVGRLKLRDFLDGTGELIFYMREDSPDPTGSYYQISSTSDPDGLRRVLSDSLGIRGEVEKTRFLYTIGRTRVHIDQVNNLGNYIELEVVLRESENESDGFLEAREIMKKLSIEPEQLVQAAYIDLLLEGV